MVKILFFGRLAEISGRHELEVEGFTDTRALDLHLHKLYPELAGMHYLTAVDKDVISGTAELRDNMTVALLPPFSGG